MSGLLHEADQLTVSELVESDILRCLLCKKIFQTPRLLPCLHSFCQECIQGLLMKTEKQFQVRVTKQSNNDNKSTTSTHSQSKQNNEEYKKLQSTVHEEELNNQQQAYQDTIMSLTCPICQSAIEVSNSITEVFPPNTFLQDLCEMYDYKHEKERSCEYCKFDGKKVFATALCLDCQDNMCDECTSAHHRTKITRGHKIIPYLQVQMGRYDTDIREYQHQKCKHHENTVYTMFCDRCEVMICSECKVEAHDTHKWTTLEKAVPKYHTQMRNLLKGIQKQVPSIHNYLRFLSNYDNSVIVTQEKLKANIEKQTDMLHSIIDEQKAVFIEQINTAVDKERCEIEVKRKNLKTAAVSLELNARYLSSLLNLGKSDEILSLHRQITQRLTQLIHMQLDGIKTQMKIGFSPGKSNSQNIQIVFGKISIDHTAIGQPEEGFGAQGNLSISSVLPSVRNSVELMMSFDANGKNDSKDVWPTGLAITKRDEIVIADRENKTVKIYDVMGKLKTEFSGQGENKLGSPFDIAILKTGDLAITDYEAEDVKIFSMNGVFQLKIKGNFKHPRGITTNSKGEIIVVDCQMKQITVHNAKTGKTVRTIEAKDSHGAKLLVDPYYVTVTPHDNIVVTDTAAPNIKVFSSDGLYLANYGGYGTRKEQVLQPYGVCCDDYGYTFVADNQNHRVHLLLPDGKHTKFLITKTDTLWHPMRLAINQKGYLILTEALGKVKIYRYI